MNILDNIKGSPIRSHRVYCGPTIGWIEAPIFQDKVLTTADAPIYRVQPWDSVLLVSMQVLTSLSIYLPSSRRWYNKDYGSWSIYIKDIHGLLTPTAGILIQVEPDPGGPAESIDGIDSYTMITPYSSIMLRPRSSLNGWYSL